MEHETGESAQGEVYLERLLEAMRRAGPEHLFASGMSSMAMTTIARITGVPDRWELAESAAEAVLEAQPVTPIIAMQSEAGLAMLAVLRGDQSAAEEHYS